MALVAVATCRALEGNDDDHLAALDALRRLGIDATTQIWDDPIEWGACDMVLVRSTWDYTDRLDEFLSWARRVPRLENPAAVLEWNTDKRYLVDLAAAGVPVISTAYIRSGDDLVVPDSPRFVVKPSVGAGSRGAARFDADDADAARHHVDELAARGLVAMVQPYLESVDERGETAALFFDGVFSHAIEKGAMLSTTQLDPSGLYVTERIAPREATDAELDVARRALEAATQALGLGSPLLYARVDLIEGASGPEVIELEVTEPSLFLAFSEGAADRFARAVEARL
jgi:glutathione synthase/RimK-type ligase-like ATP-grasp enzyme